MKTIVIHTNPSGISISEAIRNSRALKALSKSRRQKVYIVAFLNEDGLVTEQTSTNLKSARDEARRHFRNNTLVSLKNSNGVELPI